MSPGTVTTGGVVSARLSTTTYGQVTVVELPAKSSALICAVFWPALEMSTPAVASFPDPDRASLTSAERSAIELSAAWNTGAVRHVTVGGVRSSEIASVPVAQLPEGSQLRPLV